MAKDIKRATAAGTWLARLIGGREPPVIFSTQLHFSQVISRPAKQPRLPGSTLTAITWDSSLATQTATTVAPATFRFLRTRNRKERIWLEQHLSSPIRARVQLTNLKVETTRVDA